MNLLPKEIMDLIVEYSIEKKKINPHQAQSPLILNYNINPWRSVCYQLNQDYHHNPPPTILQIPVCLIS